VAGSCVHYNKPWGSVKGREFIDQINRLSASQEGLHFIEFIYLE